MRLPQVSSSTAAMPFTHGERLLGEHDATAAQPLDLAFEIVDGGRGDRDAVRRERVLEGPDGRLPAGTNASSVPSGS